MSTYILVPLLLILLLVLVVVNKRQKQEQQQSESKRPASQNKRPATKSPAVQPVADAGVAVKAAPAVEQDEVNWDAQSQSTVVSVEKVDTLTEYKVYKQFGYHQKAAESLALYLRANVLSEAVQNTLVMELASLWIQAKNPDQLTEVLSRYRAVLNKDETGQLIKEGLGIENNHLGLRVLAEELLGWGVQQTSRELGLQRDDVNGYGPEGMTEMAVQSEQGRAERAVATRQELVSGNAGQWRIDHDERDVLLAFAKPERGYRLLKDQLVYDAAIRCLNKAIQQADKPASLIIDALSLDYRNDRLSVFAQHLWRLYYSLGQYGNRVKERLLGWGYNLGNHAMFDALATAPNEQRLREIGLSQGYIAHGSSAIKAKRRTLVRNTANEGVIAENPIECILQDAESSLAYGQLEHALTLLEDAILEHPQESQLYIALFDLYERAEDWPRLEKMLYRIRDAIKTPPEEVVLAMSQLLQRIHQRGVQHQ